MTFWSNWSDWSAFWAMGGYGFYVWGSFGAAAAVMIGELLTLAARRKALKQAPQEDAPREHDYSETPHEA